MNRIILSLGSNIGDRVWYVQRAIKLISRQVVLNYRTKIIETTPIGPSKADFLNCALEVLSLLGPENILKKTQRIERQLGRERKTKWGERTIDIDILLFNDIQFTTPSLVIPHPEIQNRKFIIELLNEIEKR
jgi:2-amino-4-hydroxy-6-hydroxymethyldihydropteridine diphosphokinase